MKLLDGAFGLRDAVHLDKAEAFGALGVLVGDDFDMGYGADAGEQLEEVALRRVIGQVADVEAGGGDFDILRFARLARGAGFAVLAGFTRRTRLAGFVTGALAARGTLGTFGAFKAFGAVGGRSGGLRREAEERFDFIPQTSRLAGLAGDFEVVAGTRRTG